MKILVFQSYRTENVPRALERSMASARAWATLRGYDYQFLDDRFFDVLPAWYRERAGNHKLLLANLARLVVARNVLGSGYDRAIWLDADVVVWDPERFVVEPTEGFAFCRETWVERRHGELAAQHRICNAACAFDRGNPFLKYAIWAHETLVRDRPQHIYRFGTSTTLLTMIHAATPIPQLTGVALFSPAMVRALAGAGDDEALRELVRAHGYPMQAANLSRSMVDVTHDGVAAAAEHYDAAVDHLLATRGAALDGAGVHASAAPAPAQSRGTR